MLPRHTCHILSHLHCNEHSLLLSSYLSYDGQKQELFLQHLRTVVPRYLSFCTRPRSLFLSQQAQYAHVFVLKSMPFCMLFAGLCSTNKSATSLPCSYLTLLLSSPSCSFLHLSFYLKLCGRSDRNCCLLPPILSSCNGFPDTCFSWEMMWLARREYYLHLLEFFVVSLFFSQTGGILSHSNLLTHMFP